MKNINITAIILFALGAIAIVMVMSPLVVKVELSSPFGAVGQSRQQLSAWQIQTSAAFAAAAWKINTETGDTYYCVAQQQQCLVMVDPVVK